MPSQELAVQRRYSAIVFEQPGAQDLAAIKALLPTRIGRHRRVDVHDSWDSASVDFNLGSSLYPERLVQTESKPNRTRWPHTIFISFGNLRVGDKTSRHCLIASPYHLILHTFFNEMSASLGGKRPAFAQPDMTGVFRRFTLVNDDEMRARKITVQIDGDYGVEKVALTGKNPLRSELNDAVERVALPYAIRVDTTNEKMRTKVNLDRFGNLFWHLTSIQHLRNPLALLDTLSSEGLFSTTRSLPLLRRDPDDED